MLTANIMLEINYASSHPKHHWAFVSGLRGKSAGFRENSSQIKIVGTIE